MDTSQVSSRSLVAEFLGTMGLIVAAIGSVVLVTQAGMGTPVPFEFILINAIAVGFVLFALIESFGPLSGAHFNPAVTIAMTVSGDCSVKKAGLYIIVQMIGAFAGVMMVNMFYYDSLQELFFVSDIPRDTAALFLSEVFCAFMLVAVIFSCVRSKSDKTSLVVGLFVGGMILTTSSTMFANPAVDFARIFTNAACGIEPLSALYFIVANIIGAIAAVPVFGWLYPKKGDGAGT